jgi:hypothetical protein
MVHAAAPAPLRILSEPFRAVRAETERRAAPLSPEDQIVQSMPDASPTKWHRAHTTWFFEQFLLKPHARIIGTSTTRFAFLFNSYYVAAGPRHARPERGLITRPDAAEVAAYRAHVDRAVLELLESADPGPRSNESSHRRDRPAPRAAAPGTDPHRHPARVRAESDESRLRSGLAHGPRPPDAADYAALRPACAHRTSRAVPASASTTSSRRIACCCAGRDRPRSRDQRRMARLHGRRRLSQARPVAVGRLGHGQAEGWNAPGYWREIDGEWFTMTLAGLRRSIRRRCATSATTRPTPSRAGPASICRPRRMGSRRACGLLDDAFGVGLAMDPQRLFARIRATAPRRRARRVQRQVHGQPDGAARLVAGDARRPRARRPTAISFYPPPAGSSAACGSSTTTDVPRTANRGRVRHERAGTQGIIVPPGSRASEGFAAMSSRA